MKRCTTLLLILMVVSADAQSQFKMFGWRFGASKTWWYQNTLTDADADNDFGSQKIDSVFRKKAPGAAWTSTRPAVISVFDCDDANAAVNHSAQETCNGIDDDCDGAAEIRYKYFTDANGDGFGDSFSDTVWLCDTPPPGGFTVKEPVEPDIYFSSAGIAINMSIHDNNMEAGYTTGQKPGSSSAGNCLIDWNSPLFIKNASQLNTYEWSAFGSSFSHSTYIIKNDIVAEGPQRKGNQVNGKYLSWGKAPDWRRVECRADKTPCNYWQKDSVLNGIAAIQFNRSFLPYIAEWTRSQQHAKLTFVINANFYDWQGNKWLIHYLDSLGIFSGKIVAGLELTGRNYNNPQAFPDGVKSYLNNVLNPLIDSLAAVRPGTLVIAECDDPVMGAKSKWNPDIATSKANGVRGYFLKSNLTNKPCMSIDSLVDIALINRLNAFSVTFPGKGLYIHQWKWDDPDVNGTLRSAIYVARMEMKLITRSLAHTGYILGNHFMGMRNLKLDAATPDNDWLGLYQSGKLFYPGNVVLTAVTSIPNIYCVGTQSTDGTVTVEVINENASDVRINTISIGGYVYTTFNGEVVTGTSLDDRNVSLSAFSGSSFPANSITVLKF